MVSRKHTRDKCPFPTGGGSRDLPRPPHGQVSSFAEAGQRVERPDRQDSWDAALIAGCRPTRLTVPGWKLEEPEVTGADCQPPSASLALRPAHPQVQAAATDSDVAAVC